MLSAMGVGRNAKRAAFIHLYFNLIGTALFMAVFYAVHAIAPPAFLVQAADGVGIALIHSVFNIAATAVLLPFYRELAGLACLTTGGEKKR